MTRSNKSKITRIDINLYDIRGQVAKDMSDMTGREISCLDIDRLLANIAAGIRIQLIEPQTIKGRKKIIR